jgi:hypothetical protein
LDGEKKLTELPTLFDRDRHEALDAAPWSESEVRGAIERIVGGVCGNFTGGGLWPVHPLDRRDAIEPFRMLYYGAAGVMWGLDYLHRAGAVGPPPDFSAARAGLLESNRRLIRRFSSNTASLLMGDAGILLLDWKESRSDHVAAELATAVSQNHEHPALELMWGAPGTMIAALTMHEWTDDERWVDLFRTSATALWRTLERDSELGVSLWTQDLYGARSKLIGAVHGFAGNVFPIVRGRDLLPAEEWTRWRRRIAETIEGTAIREEGLANWPQSIGAPRPGGTALLVQHCHGAPGLVNCLADVPGPELDDLLADAGELTWRAGPLKKGPNLCHGTAGNGYALLKLFRRTENPVWLDRARTFAMHAIAQSDRRLQEFGRYHASLWTGDVGLACYLWSCIQADSAFPTMDFF